MADTTPHPQTESPSPSRGPQVFASLAYAWQRVSRRLVPVFAVITALIITVPLMIAIRAGGNVGEGLQLARSAYTALFEGAAGLTINSLIEVESVDTVLLLAQNEAIQRRDLLNLSRQARDLISIGVDNVREYHELIQRYESLEPIPDRAALDELGQRIPDIKRIGGERLSQTGPLLLALEELSRREVSDTASLISRLDELNQAQRAELEAFVPEAANYDDDALIGIFRHVNRLGIVRVVRAYEQWLVLNALGLTEDDEDAEILYDIHQLTTGTSLGVDNVEDLAAAMDRFEAAGLDDITELESEFRLVNNLYSSNVISNNNVAVALGEELSQVTDNGLVVRRPNNRILYSEGTTASYGVIYTERVISSTESKQVALVAYARLGDRIAMFFPGNLEETITRSIPYIIAGLAVALGFKAGLFNIGAEGQLYAGAILGTWIGFSGAFSGLPWLLHVPLMIMAGMLGGALWGMIPGVLKAYTGAHEVINTIMLNFVAIRLVDWLIKSTDPIILLDTSASTPRTPFIATSARLPKLDTLDTWIFLAAGLITLLVALWSRREKIKEDLRFVIRPVIYAVLVIIGGMFLSWMTVRGNLHVGLVIMIGAVWFVDWFLERTTIGFELRTVGQNPDAARYAGMNVKFNIVLAMTLSGSLAGLAGVTQISGLQHNMWPEFFSGLGFDSIAVALLARNNPRNMIPAGLLWGGLLTGAGLMQATADISIDLVKIIQALIIMFIAADAIIRTLYRVPEATAEEKASAMFSKGWGS